MPLNLIARQLELLQTMLCFQGLDVSSVDTLTRIWQPRRLKDTLGLAVIPKMDKVRWTKDQAPDWAPFNLALAMLLFHADSLPKSGDLSPLDYNSAERSKRDYLGVLKDNVGPDQYLLTARGARQYRHAAREFPGDFLVLPVMMTEENGAADQVRLEDEGLLPLDAFSTGIVLLTNRLAGQFKFEDRPVFQMFHAHCPGSQHRDPRHQGVLPSVWHQVWSDKQVVSNIRDRDSHYVLDDTRKSATIVAPQQSSFTIHAFNLWGLMPPWM